MTTSFISIVRNALTATVMAFAVAACNLGSYDDAVDDFNNNQPPPPPPPPAGFGPNFSEIQANVFTPTCATSTCHSGAGQAGLLLDAANSYTMLFGVASTQDAGTLRVNPGNPDMSYLIQKLEGPGASGGQMPPTGALPQADIDVIRQWITDGAIDDTAQPATPVRVISMTPIPGAALNAAPAQIMAGFDRDVDPNTVNLNTFLLTASGGDNTFGEANDVAIVASSITVPVGNMASAIFVPAAALGDETYQVSLLGDGASVIMDMDANALDGELIAGLPSGDGTAGGDFVSQFTVTTPVVLGPTLDQIQAVIFTPICSGCHGGGSPSANLDLSDADTSHMQLVGIASDQKAGATRVIINDPDNSYLIQKLENDPGIVLGPMPPGFGLPQADIDEIRQWITLGADR